MKKRILALFLVLATLVSVFPLFALTAFAEGTEYTEEDYDRFYVRENLAFQADFFDNNPYWNKGVTVSAVESKTGNDLDQFISYSANAQAGHMYVNLGNTIASSLIGPGYLDMTGLSASSTGFMLNSEINGSFNSGYDGVTYQYVAEPHMRDTGYAVAVAGVRIQFTPFGTDNDQAYLRAIHESNTGLSLNKAEDYSFSNRAATDFTVFLDRPNLMETGTFQGSVAVSGNVYVNLGEVNKDFGGVISSNAVPMKAAALHSYGTFSFYTNGKLGYTTDAFPYFFAVNMTSNGGGATFDPDATYYIKGTMTKADSLSNYRFYFTKDEEGDGYTIFRAGGTTKPTLTEDVKERLYVYSIDGDTYFPVKTQDFLSAYEGFVPFYTKEGDVYTEVKLNTYRVTSVSSIGDGNYYNNCFAKGNTKVYALRLYKGALTADQMAQNHLADMMKYYKLDLTKANLLTDESIVKLAKFFSDATYLTAAELASEALYSQKQADLQALLDEKAAELYEVQYGAFTGTSGQQKTDIINLSFLCDTFDGIDTFAALPLAYLTNTIEAMAPYVAAMKADTFSDVAAAEAAFAAGMAADFAELYALNERTEASDYNNLLVQDNGLLLADFFTTNKYWDNTPVYREYTYVNMSTLILRQNENGQYLNTSNKVVTDVTSVAKDYRAGQYVTFNEDGTISYSSTATYITAEEYHKYVPSRGEGWADNGAAGSPTVLPAPARPLCAAEAASFGAFAEAKGVTFTENSADFTVYSYAAKSGSSYYRIDSLSPLSAIPGDVASVGTPISKTVYDLIAGAGSGSFNYNYGNATKKIATDLYLFRLRTVDLTRTGEAGSYAYTGTHQSQAGNLAYDTSNGYVYDLEIEGENLRYFIVDKEEYWSAGDWRDASGALNRFVVLNNSADPVGGVGYVKDGYWYMPSMAGASMGFRPGSAYFSVHAKNSNERATMQLVQHPISPAKNPSYHGKSNTWASTGVGHFIFGNLRLCTPFAETSGVTDEVSMTLAKVGHSSGTPLYTLTNEEKTSFLFPAYTTSTLSFVIDRVGYGTEQEPLLKIFQDAESKVVYNGAEISGATAEKAFAGTQYLLGWSGYTAWRMYALRLYNGELTEAEMKQNHFYDVAKFYRLNINLYDSMTEEEKAVIHDAVAGIDLELGERVSDDPTGAGRDYAREMAQAAYLKGESAVLTARAKAAEDNVPEGVSLASYLAFLSLSVEYRYDIQPAITSEIVTHTVYRDVNDAALLGKSYVEVQAFLASAVNYALHYAPYEKDGDAKREAFLKSAETYGVAVEALYQVPEMANPANAEEKAFNDAFYDDVAEALAGATDKKTTLEAYVAAQATALRNEYGYTEYINVTFEAEDYNELYVRDQLILQYDFFQTNEYWGWKPEGTLVWTNGTNIFNDPHILVYAADPYSAAYFNDVGQSILKLEDGRFVYNKNGTHSNYGQLHFSFGNATVYRNDTWGTWEMVSQWYDVGGVGQSIVYGDLRLVTNTATSTIGGFRFNWGGYVPSTPMTQTGFTATPTEAAPLSAIPLYNDTAKTYIHSDQVTTFGTSFAPIQNRPGSFGWSVKVHNPEAGDADYEKGDWGYSYGSTTGTMTKGKHDEHATFTYYMNGANAFGDGVYYEGDNNALPGANAFNMASDTYFGYNCTGFHMDLYAIRFYDKELSPAEYAQNHFVDLAKFFRLDLTHYVGLSDEEKAQLHGRFTLTDSNNDGVTEGLSFDSAREEVVAAYETALLDIAFADVIAGAEASESFDLYLDLLVSYNLKSANLLSFLPASYRDAVLEGVFAKLYDVSAFPQDQAVLDKLITDAVAAYADPAADVTFTHDEYNALYARLDHLGTHIDFFAAKASDEPADIDVNGTAYGVGSLGGIPYGVSSLGGIVEKGGFTIQNHPDLYANYGGSPKRYLRDGYFEMAVPYSNITVVPFSNVAGEVTTEAYLNYSSNDYTLEVVMQQATDRSAVPQWIQYDGMRVDTQYYPSTGFAIDGTGGPSLTVHTYNTDELAWRTTSSQIPASTPGVTGFRVAGDENRAHTISLRMDKTLELQIRYYELVKNGDQYTVNRITEEQVKAIAGEGVKFPTPEEVHAHTSAGLTFGNTEGYTADGVTKWVHAFAFDGTADFVMALDNQVFSSGVDQDYSRYNAPMSLGSDYTGKIFSIRRYDISLTDEELAQNHFVDLAKFYSLDVSAYLLMSDAQKQSVHTAMRSYLIYDDEALVKAAYFAAVYENCYASMLLDSADAAEYANLLSGDTTGEEFVASYNRLLLALGKSNVDATELLKLAPENYLPLLAMANGFTTNFKGLDKAVVTGVLKSVLDERLSLESLVSQLITFRGYQVRIGNAADEAALAAGAIGVRSVYAFDKEALAALEALGYSVTFGATVTALNGNAQDGYTPGRALSEDVYKNGEYQILEDGRLPYYEAGQGGFRETSFVLTLRFYDVQNFADTLNREVMFTYYVIVDDGEGNVQTFTFGAPSRTFGDTVSAGEVYGEFYGQAEEVNAVTKAATSIAKNETYATYIVGGIELSQFTILYSEKFGLAEALELQAAIKSKTGVALPVLAEGASYKWSDTTPYLYLVSTRKNPYAATEIKNAGGAEVEMGHLWSEANRCLYLINASDVVTSTYVEEYFLPYLNTLEDGAAFSLKSFE